MKKPHIVFYGVLNLHIGGTERNLLHHLAVLAESYRLTVLSRASREFQEQLTHADYCPVDRVPPAFSPTAIRQLAHQLKHVLQADLVVTLEPRSLTIGGPAGRLAGIPVLHWHNISPLDYSRNPVKKLVYALGEGLLAWSCLDGEIFVSQNMHHLYTRYWLVPRSRSHFLPVTLDVARYQAIRQQREMHRQRWHVAPDEFLWVNLGRYHPQKGQDVLLQAAAMLGQHRHWKLVLAGGGELESDLQRQIQKCSLQSRVHLAGGLPHDQAVELLAAADGLVLPSRYENRPITVLEAMAMTIPCIVTDVGDSWLMSGGGELPPASVCVPVENAELLAKAMQNLMSDAGLHHRLAEAGTARAAQFDSQDYLPRIEALYRAFLHE
ncbi:MAG: glycosyltransferase [Anaerolineae bacterium]|nr:glycosyltransferase [Anaerolineae bacterium]